MKNRREELSERMTNEGGRSRNGITLVALVVTIIILLILAGVSLNLVAGSNGILGKAKNATEISKLAATKEQLQLDLAAAQMDVLANGELEISQKNLTEIVSKYGELQEDGDTIVTENGDISLKEIYQKSANEGDSNLDISGGETIDSTEVSKLVAEMQNLKTEVNTLKTANNSMQSSITALKDSLSPTSYIKPTAVEGVRIHEGGYYRIGNTVYVNISGFDLNTNILSFPYDVVNRTGMVVVMLGLPEAAEDTELFMRYSQRTEDGGFLSALGLGMVTTRGEIQISGSGEQPYWSMAGMSLFGTYLAKE